MKNWIMPKDSIIIPLPRIRTETRATSKQLNRIDFKKIRPESVLAAKNAPCPLRTLQMLERTVCRVSRSFNHTIPFIDCLDIHVCKKYYQRLAKNNKMPYFYNLIPLVFALIRQPAPSGLTAPGCQG